MTLSEASTRKQALLFREHQNFAEWANQWNGWKYISGSGADIEQRQQAWTGWIACKKQTDVDWIECERVIRGTDIQRRNPDGFQKVGEDNLEVRRQ